ncbi:two-component-system connector protein AriR [Leclercia sp. LSNIH6]|uniref:biofilm development regulator YmgB/AriR family protein n=1 Tax=unclassified Leclercia TaxID=2627398 RepID=UPI000CDE222B|nr:MULTISPECIES: biofilm development regulator YmgB/AriR family protein [unclassified Leclercia]POU71466.1 two-component-system connector protein AriR [Leclercia sp. LSNIH7]POU80056.1 two-component-system connector protein AriR [Leclercia sp. LSNIH6]POW50936.1 two-component-system connector protein AriR [Leclercia sp. LSNIH8]AXF58522.1 two-component-system connector protein AriR [Leclercia sp. W6]QGU11557.1 two-component-system connector protein AriR [Leclercia sp. J807]
MSQAMLQTTDFYEELPNAALSNYFRSAGAMLAEEWALLQTVTGAILDAKEPLTNKAIILRLIREIESTRDVVRADIIRKTLEIIVDHTQDDL